MSRPPDSVGPKNSAAPSETASAAGPTVAEHDLWPPTLDDEDAGVADEPTAATVIEHDAPPGWTAEPVAEEAPDASEALGPLSPERLRSVIESLLFASERPLTIQRIVELLEEIASSPREPSGPPLYQNAQIKDVLTQLGAELQGTQRGIELHEVAGGWQLLTAAQNAPWVQRMLQAKPVRLSRAQLETMAIVAYRQPVTRPEIDDIRGVDSGGSLKTLLDRQMVRVLGKKEEPGRPLLYGTTREFLEFFNLRDLKDLPTLREYHDLTDENREKMRSMGHEPPVPGAAHAANGSIDGMPVPSGADGATATAVDVLHEPQAGTAAFAPAGPGAEPTPLAAAPGGSFAARRELIDQQLADDAEQLAKIDEMIRAVNTAFPLLDPTLLGMVADGTLPPPGAFSPASTLLDDADALAESPTEDDSPTSRATSGGSDDREPEEL